MREHPHGQAGSELVANWLGWPARHPGIVLLGTLVVAILAFSGEPKLEDTDLDSTGEEVPLFI